MGDSYVHMMSEDTEVEALSLSPPVTEVVAPAKGGKSGTKRSVNYTHQEDIQLCISWEAITNDPVVGNEQPGKSYWKRIAEHFHANRDFESDRNANSLEHRWSTIQRECSKFQGYYDQVERRHPSGIPYKEHILEAQAMYSAKDPKSKSFPFLHCWIKVRNCPKFQALDTHKRPRTSKSPTPSESATEQEDEDGSSKSATPDSLQPPNKKRPIGRKQAKEKLKNGGEAGPYKETLQDLLVVKEKEAKLKEIEVKLKEDRWKESKEIAERKISFEERKLMWEQEQKIMFCDVSTLEPDQRAYVSAMRAQIAAQKVAALNRSLEGAAGSFGGEFGGGSASFGGGDNLSQI